MRLLLRALVMAAALAAAPALAQSTPEPSEPSASSGDLIGPPQLSNFSLHGRVTQPPAQQLAPEPKPTPMPTRAARQSEASAATSTAPIPSSTALTKAESPEAAPV